MNRTPKRSKAWVKKDCHLKVIKHPKDCACHKPVSRQKFNRNRCFKIIKGVKPLIQLRLAGINSNLNFELFRHKGSMVIIEVVSGEKSENIRGFLSQVGTDYVDIKKSDGKVVTILQSQILKIVWLDRKKASPLDRAKYIGDFHSEEDGDFLEDFEE
ncbi:hypothetical protein ACH6EH_18840 [Paenibacillus sp. JSM ZJ436]|uniref:hypothetical protein n=1 Tax=Paenibacillus sp. JSM ZJ436 TaxID=3376190 RepID=UPI0037A4C7F1